MIKKLNHLNQERKKINKGNNLQPTHKEEPAIITLMELKRNRNNHLQVQILHKKVMIKVKY